MSDHRIWNTDLFYDSLKTKEMGKKLIYKNITGSTMDDARKLANDDKGNPHGTVILAETQTHARGARDHVWDASNMGNIYASFILHQPHHSKSFEGRFQNEVCACLAVSAAVRQLGIDGVSTKWPNDVWIRGRKLAGNLAEDGGLNVTGGNKCVMVLGIGINVNADTKQNPELCNIATSLRCENKMAFIERETFFADVCFFLEKYLDSSCSLLLKEFNEQNVFQTKSAMLVTRNSDGKRYDASFVDIYDNWDIGFIDKATSELVRGRSDQFTCRPLPH